MRDYIQVDLKRYINPDTIIELQKSQYSQKASKYMQTIFKDLINTVREKESEIQELNERLNTLESALKRQQRHVMSRNEAMANHEVT